MFQSLLICTDLVDGLQRLVHFVPSLAVGGVQRIVFLHVTPLSGDQAVPRADEVAMQVIRDRLSVAKNNVPAGVDVQIEVQCGYPVDRILNVAANYKSDVILLGTQSRSLLTEKLFGSTAITLCQRSKIPLLILRPQLLSTYTVAELDLRCRYLFRYFLIPYDGSNVADYLLEQIKKLAKERPNDSLEECLLSWVIESSGRKVLNTLLQEETTKKATAKLATAKTELEALGLKVATQISYGESVPEILLEAQNYDITAIATASDSLGKLLELSIPSFTGELLRRSWHPIIYFPIVKS